MSVECWLDILGANHSLWRSVLGCVTVVSWMSFYDFVLCVQCVIHESRKHFSTEIKARISFLSQKRVLGMLLTLDFYQFNACNIPNTYYIVSRQTIGPVSQYAYLGGARYTHTLVTLLE